MIKYLHQNRNEGKNCERRNNLHNIHNLYHNHHIHDLYHTRHQHSFLLQALDDDMEKVASFKLLGDVYKLANRLEHLLTERNGSYVPITQKKSETDHCVEFMWLHVYGDLMKL